MISMVSYHTSMQLGALTGNDTLDVFILQCAALATCMYPGHYSTDKQYSVKSCGPVLWTAAGLPTLSDSWTAYTAPSSQVEHQNDSTCCTVVLEDVLTESITSQPGVLCDTTQ